MSSKYEQRKQFFDNINLLVKSEQIDMFKILKNSGSSFTENSNGIFFDVMTLSDETFNKMENFMSFVLKTRQEDQERTTKLKKMMDEGTVN
jgi:hypothetical protein